MQAFCCRLYLNSLQYSFYNIIFYYLQEKREIKKTNDKNERNNLAKTFLGGYKIPKKPKKILEKKSTGEKPKISMTQKPQKSKKPAKKVQNNNIVGDILKSQSELHSL